MVSKTPVARQYRLLLLFSVVIPLIGFIAVAWSNRNDEVEAARQAVQRNAAVLDEHARRVFDTAELILLAVDAYVADMSWDDIRAPATQEFLRRTKKHMPHVVAIWVADGAGYAQAGSEPDWDRNQPISDRDFFSVHVEQDIGTYISPAFVSRATRQASFAVSRRKSSVGGSFDGTIHLSLSPDYFSRIFEEMAAELPMTSVLVRQDGYLLARSSGSIAIPGGRYTPSSPLMPHMEAGFEKGIEAARSTLDGETRIYAFRKVADYPLYVSVGVNQSAVEASWLRNTLHYALLCGLAVLALLLVSSLAIRRARAEQEALIKLERQTAQRAEAEQKLFRSEKMQSIGQLTGGLAHDFNNLLAVILGNLSILKRRIGDNPDLAKFVDRALKGAERGASLTQRLLAFARQQDLTPSDVDIPDVVTSIQDLLRRSLGPSIRIVTDFAAGLPPTKVDPHQLELSLINLVVNARDAMPDGGTITIRAEPVDVAAGDADLQPGGYVRIAVSDTGTGMDEDTLAHAIEPFFTTKGVGKGTGLGLSMVQGLAHQSGGVFRLSSKPGQGTTAELWLPKGDGVAQAHRDTAPDALPASGSYTILAVDDDELVLASTAELLRDSGHVPLEAGSGVEAQRLLQTRPIDLVITDHLMPGMTGLQLVEWIRARWPSLPVLLATGHADLPEQGLPVMRLRKPFQQAELDEAVRQAMAATDKAPRLAS